MDMKVYKKTRYQNIYKHKNGNYVVKINKPIRSSISRVDGEKIWRIEDALKIRDNPKTGYQKKAEILYKDNMDSMWEKYIDWCKYVDKQSYNTYHKKEIIYNSYLKEKFKKPISKYNRNDFAKFVDELDTTDVMKNHILKHLKTCLNWCVSQGIIIDNPLRNIKMYKTTKKEMKYWTTEEIKKFFNYMNTLEDEESYRIKILVLLGFMLGDRIGETRALFFSSINKQNNTITINHSINYNPDGEDYISHTKTKYSQRTIDVSENLISAIEEYKDFLIKKGYNITDNSLIFFNHQNNKPYSDSYLRNQFYKYCEDAGVSKIRLYDLRHTYVATMMQEGKELYLISERLGHTSYSTTVNKYGHLSNEVRKEIAKTTDKYVF